MSNNALAAGLVTQNKYIAANAGAVMAANANAANAAVNLTNATKNFVNNPTTANANRVIKLEKALAGHIRNRSNIMQILTRKNNANKI
jgi:hypothetical protein